jgi:hypothetical protein
MIPLAGLVVVLFALFLLAFTCVTFARPALVERFLGGFASSARTHYLEQIVRLVVGAALVVVSPVMWQPELFWLIGWAVVVSSAALMCTPWRWHQRLAQRLLPTVLRHLKLSALGPFAFGALLLFAVFAR